MNDSTEKDETDPEQSDVIELTNTVDKTETDKPATPAMADPEVSGVVDELVSSESDDKDGESFQPGPPLVRNHWVNNIFDELYFDLIEEKSPEQLEDELNFIVDRLSLRRDDGQLLDIACGSGQYTVELQKRGVDAIGLDQSSMALARAKKRAKRVGISMKLIRADMRELEFDSIFSKALIWGNSIGYFGRAADLEVLEGVCRLLESGGDLLLEAPNRDFVRNELPHRNWWEVDDYLVLEEASFNPRTSCITVSKTISDPSADKKHRREFEMRIYALHEIEEMLREAGLSVVEVSGNINHPGRFFGANNRQMIILARG